MIKPCPFCGSEHAPLQYCFLPDEYYHEVTYAVICNQRLNDGCGAMTGRKRTIEDAIAAWNTRKGEG